MNFSGLGGLLVVGALSILLIFYPVAGIVAVLLFYRILTGIWAIKLSIIIGTFIGLLQALYISYEILTEIIKSIREKFNTG